MRQPGSPRSQSRSKAAGSWQDAYWWQRHGHRRDLRRRPRNRLAAELDKPDDQAKKDVSIVDVKNPVLQSSADHIHADELSAYAADDVLRDATVGRYQSWANADRGVPQAEREAFRCIPSSGQRFESPSAGAGRDASPEACGDAFVLIRPLPGPRGMVAPRKATGTRTRHRHMLPFCKAR